VGWSILKLAAWPEARSKFADVKIETNHSEGDKCKKDVDGEQVSWDNGVSKNRASAPDAIIALG